MPGKMDKKDVKLSYKDASRVNWTHVQQCSGVSVPQIAKQAVKDALENKKYKKLTVKIGLIKKDLYLRIKNGNDHVQDVKIAPNWTPPEGWVQPELGAEEGDDDEEVIEQPPIDLIYQQKLNEWKQGKEAAKRLGEETIETITQAAAQAEISASRAEEAADRVYSGGDNPTYGKNNALQEANEMVERIRGLVQQAGQAYQRYFVVYNVHRSGEKGEEFRKEDRDGYGINFFMRVLKPLDQNAVALKDGIDTLLGKAEAAVQEITAFQQQGPNEAYLLKAQSIRRQADALLLKSKGVLGSMTGDIEKMVTKGSGLFKDLEEVFKETNHEMKLVRAGTALQRLTGVREAVPRMEAYLKEMKILMKDVGKIPKNLTKDNQIKPELDGFVRAYKETTEYHSQWHKHAATAEKTYLEILNRVNK